MVLRSLHAHAQLLPYATVEKSSLLSKLAAVKNICPAASPQNSPISGAPFCHLFKRWRVPQTLNLFLARGGRPASVDNRASRASLSFPPLRPNY